jgi:hypothetical protein
MGRQWRHRRAWPDPFTQPWSRNNEARCKTPLQALESQRARSSPLSRQCPNRPSDEGQAASASTVFGPLVEFLQCHAKGWIRLKFRIATQSFRDALLGGLPSRQEFRQPKQKRRVFKVLSSSSSQLDPCGRVIRSTLPRFYNGKTIYETGFYLSKRANARSRIDENVTISQATKPKAKNGRL